MKTTAVLFVLLASGGAFAQSTSDLTGGSPSRAPGALDSQAGPRDCPDGNCPNFRHGTGGQNISGAAAMEPCAPGETAQRCTHLVNGGNGGGDATGTAK